MKVLIAVTHLLGTGHLARAMVLGRAFAEAGHAVRVLSGGRPTRHVSGDGVTLVQLPALASDGTNFTRLLDVGGREAGPDILMLRMDRMAAEMRDFQPDVVITELFPFGRRVLAQEFLGLIDLGQQLPRPPLVFASIRDILAPPSKPAKATRAEKILLDHYDGVLVHSDAAIATLDQSWPVSARLEPMLHYTGFVAPEFTFPDPDGPGRGEVLVSAGGGAVGDALFIAAIKAATTDTRTWRILIGGHDPNARIAALSRNGVPENAILEPVRPDFRALLARAAGSVSMCGYNTAMDLLQTGIPSVIVPFDDGGEVEQTLRARALSRQDGIEMIAGADLSGAALARTMSRAMQAPRRDTSRIGMDGAQQAVRIVEEMYRARDEE